MGGRGSSKVSSKAGVGTRHKYKLLDGWRGRGRKGHAGGREPPGVTTLSIEEGMVACCLPGRRRREANGAGHAKRPLPPSRTNLTLHVRESTAGSAACRYACLPCPSLPSPPPCVYPNCLFCSFSVCLFFLLLPVLFLGVVCSSLQER